jgi:hypothetical protein
MRKLLIISFTLLFFSCYLIPCNFDKNLVEIENKKNESFFIGKYFLELSINNNFDYNKTELILDKNGELKINRISSKTFPWIKGKERLISAKGNWKLVYIKNRKDHYLSLSIKFQKTDNLEDFGLSKKFYQKKGSPVILLEIGDPDECKAVRFIKKSN